MVRALRRNRRGGVARPPILVADARHFGARNFPPLYDFAGENGLAIYTETSRAVWWGRADGYRGLADRLAPHRGTLQGLSAVELLGHRYRDIGVFTCARGELQPLLQLRREDDAPRLTDRETIERAFAAPEARETVLLCLAAVCDWIDFWHRLFDRDGPFACAVAARGHSIHARSLVEVALRRGSRVFVTDRFALADHFFFEERMRPGADLPLLADPDWYARLILPSDPAKLAELRARAHSRLAPLRAAVGARPSREDLTRAAVGPGEGVVLVLGRPVGEPSLLETRRPSGRDIREPLIARLRDRTAAWRCILPAGAVPRFILVNTMPSDSLLMQARFVLSLSPASTIEACRAGFKPIEFGGSALAGKGFTHDFAAPDDFLDALAAGRIAARLSLAEYRSFEDFLVRLLLHLVPSGAEGAAEIARRLARPEHVPTWREPDRTAPSRPSAWRTIREVMANPTAALRLARTWSLSDLD